MRFKKILCLLGIVLLLLTAALSLSSCRLLLLDLLSDTEDTSDGTENQGSDDGAGGDAEEDSTPVTYVWYDVDGTVLCEKEGRKDTEPESPSLPADTEKWDYVGWKKGDEPYEKIAYRTPNVSYFVGNVFQIIVQDLGKQPIATGSAFVFNSDGWFITNAHVMKDAYYAQAIFNIPNPETGESFTYLRINEGTYYHLDKDIYIGKIENYEVIGDYYKEISVDLTYEIGERTYSVGYPLSSTELIIKPGKVTESWSDLYEKLYSGNSYICSSSYIAPGSSGGILTNGDLEVIGITTLGWMDENDAFISGAAISAFNFSNLLKNTNEAELISLIERFHARETDYIACFNKVMEDEAKGLAERFYFDDGTLAYVYEWNEENVNASGVAFSTTRSILLGTDGWMEYNEEYYWADGDRRLIAFYGYYDHQEGFADFIYEFAYGWSDGDYYTVECENINYSTNVDLTLNRCVVDHSYGYTPSVENVTYAKEQFNWVYEYLTDFMTEAE